jgi:hypothetical protein
MAPENVSSFLNEGLLYMNTLEYFRTYEEKDEHLRADRYEGLEASYDSQSVEMTLVKDGTRIEPIGKIDVFQPLADSINVYCMAMITHHDLRTPFQLDRKFAKFGSKAVLIEGAGLHEFMKRLHKAVESDVNMGSIYPNGKIADSVEYVHRKDHHQKLDAFNKFNDYSWQREYRIVLGREVGSGAMSVKLGDISDIAQVVDTKELMNTVFALKQSL